MDKFWIFFLSSGHAYVSVIPKRPWLHVNNKEIQQVTDRRILGLLGPPCGGRLQSGLAASHSGPRTPGSPGSRPGTQSAWADCCTSSSPHHLYTALLKVGTERGNDYWHVENEKQSLEMYRCRGQDYPKKKKSHQNWRLCFFFFFCINKIRRIKLEVNCNKGCVHQCWMFRLTRILCQAT